MLCQITSNKLLKNFAEFVYFLVLLQTLKLKFDFFSDNKNIHHES